MAAVSYVGLLPAVVLLAIPATRSRQFVRFHCWQAILFIVAAAIVALAVKLFFLIFSILPVVGFLFSWLLLGVAAIAVVIAWLVLIVKALLGEGYEIPLLGSWAMRLAGITGTGGLPENQLSQT